MSLPTLANTPFIDLARDNVADRTEAAAHVTAHLEAYGCALLAVRPDQATAGRRFVTAAAADLGFPIRGRTFLISNRGRRYRFVEVVDAREEHERPAGLDEQRRRA